ncbi:MAG: hypothetical protein JXD22_01665 [Sedimentisphaerales bacterium]|nr:hypothetical protein [Sedimentisphaerales bacterium]
MTDLLDRYIQDKCPKPDGDYLRLQMIALGEVLKLSAEAIEPAKSQIEQSYQQAWNKAETKKNESQKKAQADYQMRQESIEADRQKHLLAAEEKFKSALARGKGIPETRRDRIISSADTQMQKAKKQSEYEIITAENIAQGAQVKCRAEINSLKEWLAKAHLALDELRMHAIGLLNRYRRKIPPGSEPEAIVEADSEKLRIQFEKQKVLAQHHLDELELLKIPEIFVDIIPLLLIVILGGIVGGATAAIQYYWANQWVSWYVTAAIALGITLAAVLFFGRLLWHKAGQQVLRCFVPLQEALDLAEKILAQRETIKLAELEQHEQKALQNIKDEINRAREQYQQVKIQIQIKRDRLIKKIETRLHTRHNKLALKRTARLQKIEKEYNDELSHLSQKLQDKLIKIDQDYQQQTHELQKRYESDHRQLHQRWQQSILCLKKLLDQSEQFNPSTSPDQESSPWNNWQPPRNFASLVKIGNFKLDLNRLAEPVREKAGLTHENALKLLPAVLSFPDNCSVLFETAGEGRQMAIAGLQAIMLALMTDIPPGRVRFTIVDPVSLGENFAGFMHASDYSEALAGRRIWTDTSHIQQQLADLTDHMETVIQKYLRNEFKTIEQYNLQAGELAEPYRFLVVADFPVGFNEESLHRLNSIVNSGKRCGVYTLIAYDSRIKIPDEFQLAELLSKSIHLLYKKEGQFVWQDRVLSQFPILLSQPPSEEILTRLVHTVGRAAKDASRVEVPFATVAPAPKLMWTSNSSKLMDLTIGSTGVKRSQHLKLGSDMAQHALIAGKTGSGKSTLFHVIITNLALWYDPDEMEVYLIDFKRGVEFKTYVTHKLPHARAIAIESDREFGLSILQRLDQEMARRGELFRQAAVQDLTSYRQATGKKLPRTLLIVDEFQVFFGEDDKLAQDAAITLEQLVRQGRAFGIHVILGSQSLGGSFGLARSVIGQMAVRIALQCSEADSQLILDDENLAARLLSRPGEAIYNDTGGLVAGNNPFQTAWLPDDQRDDYLNQVTKLAQERKIQYKPQIVFEGNVPAKIEDCDTLKRFLQQTKVKDYKKPARAWLGEPVAIKESTAVTFRRQSGANLLIVGQRDEAAMGLLSAAMVSLSVQLQSGLDRFVILDGSPADSSRQDFLKETASLLGQNHNAVPWREVPQVIAQLHEQIQQRLESEHSDHETVYLIIYGLQRYRVLRKSEDDFSFNISEEAATPTDRLFADIVCDGPLVGVHTLIWVDTYATLERMLNRQTIKEFDNRVLFQMSASDSSQLIDSPLANRLGFHRALFYSEEQGLGEKFRPFQLPDKHWLSELGKKS